MKYLKKITVSLFLLIMILPVSFAQDIGLTVSQFAKRANANLASMQSPYKMNTNLKVDPGKVNDVAGYQFSDHFSVIITVDKKTQKVKGISTIIDPTANGGDENLIMFFSNAALLSAFDGKNSMKTVGKKAITATTEAITEWSKNRSDVIKTFVFNGKKYGISVSQTTGIMSFAEFEE